MNIDAWKVIISIALLFAAFILSPLLFPHNPDISEKIMYAWFASMGVGAIPAIRYGISGK